MSKYAKVADALGEDPGVWVRRERESEPPKRGASFRSLSRFLYMEHGIDVSEPTLMRWALEKNGDPSEAVA